MIYVVQRGDSLWKIAQQYGVTAEKIARDNAIPESNRLVVGQALVILVDRYVVKPGDSLWQIAQRFGTTPEQLAAQNNLQLSSTLQIGQVLQLPQRTKTAAETLAFIEPSSEPLAPALVEAIQQGGPSLTYVSLFSYRVQRDGSLVPPPAITDVQNQTNAVGAQLSLVVTNLEMGAFSAELGQAILQSRAVQQLIIENIIEEVERLENVTNVMFDFEHLRSADRQAFVNFLQDATEQMHEVGVTVSVALAPKSSAQSSTEWNIAHDYEAIGRVVDWVLLMTYEWGYSGGPPMAVSPLPEVRQVVEYALSVIPAEKIMLGQNLYGYDWTLPYVAGGPYAEALSPQRAIQTALLNNAAIEFNERAQAPFFRYLAASGAMHEVWFEDARSIQQKFNLIKELNLRGIGYWKLGLPFPQNWLLIQENFIFRK